MDALLVSAMAVAAAIGGERTDAVQTIEVDAARWVHAVAAGWSRSSRRCDDRRSDGVRGQMLVIRDAETGEIVTRIDPGEYGEAMGRVLERLLDEGSTS